LEVVASGVLAPQHPQAVEILVLAKGGIRTKLARDLGVQAALGAQAEQVLEQVVHLAPLRLAEVVAQVLASASEIFGSAPTCHNHNVCKSRQILHMPEATLVIAVGCLSIGISSTDVSLSIGI